MLRRVAVLLIAAASTMWICVFAQPSRVQAADPVGWRPVFSESFDDAGLPPVCAPYDGASDGTQASYFRPEAVTVEDGHLILALHRRTYGGKPFVTGELRCLGAVQQYGRYEFSARVPVGAGIESLAILRPLDGQAPQHGSQLAVMARPGEPERADISNGNGTATTLRTISGSFSSGWHTYLIEWAPSGFRVVIDGKERSLDPEVSTVQRWFGFAVTAGGDRVGTPDASTALPAQFQIDYLRIWAFEPVASAPAVAAPPSTVDQARPGNGVPGRRWSLWLAVAAVLTAALALVAFVIRKTRPHRPPSSHRA